MRLVIQDKHLFTHRAIRIEGGMDHVAMRQLHAALIPLLTEIISQTYQKAHVIEQALQVLDLIDIDTLRDNGHFRMGNVRFWVLGFSGIDLAYFGSLSN